MKWTWDKFFVRDESPPDRLLVERYLLACMMRNPSLIDDVFPIIDGADFVGQKNRILFEHLVKIYHSEHAIDLIALRSALRLSGDYGTTIGVAELGRIFTEFVVADTEHVIRYAAIMINGKRDN